MVKCFFKRAAMLMALAAVVIASGCKQNITTPQLAKDTTPPAEVSTLKAVPTGNGKISVSWTNPTDADLYQVEITVQKEKEGETAVSTTVCIPAEKGKAGSYIVTELEANTKYIVTVKTIDKALNKSKDGVSKTVTTTAAGTAMAVTLSQSPAKEVKTNNDVTVTVSSSTSIKEAKWKKGVYDTKTVLESGTPIIGNSFAVSENGTYSVVVVDKEGRREVETIRIENIDKDPPAAVANLTASYSSSNTKITVSWQNPSDSDFVGLTLSWKKGTGSEIPVALAKDKTSYEIPSITPDGSTYTITVTARDDVGNESHPEERTVTATTTAEIMSVGLDRSHLDTRMSNRAIKVTITGSNLNMLTTLKVQVKEDGGMAQPAVPATISSANTATVTIQAPIPENWGWYLDPEGKEYTVKVIANGTPVLGKIATFKVTPPTKVNEIIFSKTQLPVGTTDPVTVTVRGTNFDIRGETKIKLLDSKGDEVSESMVTVLADKGTATEFSAEIPIPGASGIYTVGVYFDDKKEDVYKKEYEPTLHIYGAPEIMSVGIPKAGTPYGGNELPVTITGKNFTAPGASFSGSGASITNFTVVNDTTATAKVECPHTAGDTMVTVTCTSTSGSVSKSGTLSVKDYPEYKVGGIVRSDKTVAKAADYTAIDASNPPVAIICGDLYGVPRMIALGISEEPLVWATDKTTGYATKLTGIICIPNGKTATEATFTGDTDGSDNWAYIKQQDPEGTKDDAAVEKNYPAFYWVQKYNTTYAAQLGGKTFDWYMPSLAELCEVSKNFDVIRKSFDKIQDLPNGKDYVKNYFKGTYWSSSQSFYDNNGVWYVMCDGDSGYMGSIPKDKGAAVCCIAGF